MKRPQEQRLGIDIHLLTCENRGMDQWDLGVDELCAADALTCAREAIEAHGDTRKIDEWERRWLPLRYSEWGPLTSVQYSGSCALMDHAAILLREGRYTVTRNTDAGRQRAQQEAADLKRRFEKIYR